MPVEFYEDKAGEWRWRLKGANGEIVAHGEGHDSESDAKRAFLTAAFLAEDSVTEIATDMKKLYHLEGDEE